jgi:osmoprotectant transport system permease protein
VNWIIAHPLVIASRMGEHVVLVVLAVVLALVLALPLGIFASRRPRLGTTIVAILAGLYTIPSLAFFAFLVATFGLGLTSALIALVAYAQLALVRNIVTGLRGVPREVLEAADGLGMSPHQRLLRVELPLALPAILAGVRLATLGSIALATLAAWINAGGLGRIIFDGLHQDDPQKILAGSLAVMFLAILTDVGLRRIERHTTLPR